MLMARVSRAIYIRSILACVTIWLDIRVLWICPALFICDGLLAISALGQQQPERRVRWRLAEIGSQQLVERLPVAFGESLHSHQRALAAQDREDRHQQHPPLREADAAAHPAIGQRLEEADQIACSSRRGGGLESQ